ncbi:MAG TPA: alpha/beta fold hydrolase [Solirubrobacter sp.]|nr:alpha/beta fold hydrolase [Solirubrobacter sp.]
MRDAYAELDDVRLHYVEAGEGPLVVLLHGFPEFWYGWRHQIEPLAARGFRVVAPDLRGYNLSSKPRGRDAYRIDRLAGDVRQLIEERGAPRACVAGHDWGGLVAWATAMDHPDAVERLAILNAPHPRVFAAAVRRPRQAAHSWYILAFQLPWLPERLAPHVLPQRRHPRYREAWAQPGALTAMLNYYRALSPRTRIAAVTAPTRVIWGERDRYLLPSLAEPSRADVPHLERVIRLDTSHWVQHEAPEAVTGLLAEFFSLG